MRRASLVGARADPVRGQQVRRQQRVLQMDLAVLVDKQRADEERALAAQAAGAGGGGEWLEALHEAAVAGRPSATRSQPRAASRRSLAASAALLSSTSASLAPGMSASHSRVCAGVVPGCAKSAACTCPNPCQLQRFAHPGRPCPPRGQQQQRPAPVPRLAYRRVDALRRFGEARRAARAQAVLAAAPGTRRTQPALAREARHGGAYQALGEAERRRQAYQASRAMAPPRGATASPKIVTKREPARSGRWARKCRSTPSRALGRRAAGLALIGRKL